MVPKGAGLLKELDVAGVQDVVSAGDKYALHNSDGAERDAPCKLAFPTLAERSSNPYLRPFYQ
jgi:hypothetical protein